MPPIIPIITPETIAEVTYKYSVNLQKCQASFHYMYLSGSAVADAITATNGLLSIVSNTTTNALLNNMAAAQSNQVNYDSVSVQIVFPDRFLKFSTDIPKTGALVGGCEAQNVAGVITKQTAFAGRDAVGSLHLGGLPSSTFNAGLITTAQKTRLTVIGTSMLADINDTSNAILWTPILLNKEPIPDTDPVRFRIKGGTLLYTILVQPEIRVMRRRTVGLGI